MKVILKEPPNTPTLILRLLAPVVLTCIALPAAVADCMGNPDPQSAMTRISHLSEAPKAIQDLAKAIQSKNAAQIRDIFIHRYGPSRDAGFSGPDVELWDVAEGSLWLHPQMGPSFAPKESKTIWLLITTNKALPNILGSFEMTTLPDQNGMQTWLGELILRPDRTYTFQDSHAIPGQWTTQTDNFFKLRPAGAFKIEFAAGCTGETLLENLPNNTVLCRLVFAPEGRGQIATYSILIDDRQLVLRSDHTLTFEIRKFWDNFWR